MFINYVQLAIEEDSIEILRFKNRFASPNNSGWADYETLSVTKSGKNDCPNEAFRATIRLFWFEIDKVSRMFNCKFEDDDLEHIQTSHSL